MTKKIIITEAQLQLLSERILIENQFKLDNLDDKQIDNIFNTFKLSYEKSTGGSWDKDKFISRASGWLFFGDQDGFMAVRPQRSGLYKLVGVAGSPKSILNALNEIESQKLPVWGMVSQNIQSLLLKKGFITPTPEQSQILYKSIPPEVFGGVDTIQNPDGSLTLKYADVGDATKFFVGNQTYFNTMKMMFGDKFNLEEARSHPEQNPKVTFNSFMSELFRKYNYDDIFVSFRSGTYVTDFNRNNNYETPTGVYCYPLKSYYENKEDILNMSEKDFRSLFPYQSKLPNMYFIILKTHQGILDDTATFEQLATYVKKIHELYGDIEPINQYCESYLAKRYKSTYNNNPSHETHKFWLFLYSIAPYISKGHKIVHTIKSICNKLGINGFVDYKGDGYIHPSEKKQAVFFKIKTIADVVIYTAQDSRSKEERVYAMLMTNQEKTNDQLANFIIKMYGENKVPMDVCINLIKISSKPAEIAKTLIDEHIKNMHGNTLYLVQDALDVLRKKIPNSTELDNLILHLVNAPYIRSDDLTVRLLYISMSNGKKLSDYILKYNFSILSDQMAKQILTDYPDDINLITKIINDNINFKRLHLSQGAGAISALKVLIKHGNDETNKLILDKLIETPQAMEMESAFDELLDYMYENTKDKEKLFVFLITTLGSRLLDRHLGAILYDVAEDKKNQIIDLYLKTVKYVLPNQDIFLTLIKNSTDKINLLDKLIKPSGNFKFIIGQLTELKDYDFAHTLLALLDKPDLISDNWLSWIHDNQRSYMSKVSQEIIEKVNEKLTPIYMTRFNLYDSN